MISQNFCHFRKHVCEIGENSSSGKKIALRFIEIYIYNEHLLFHKVTGSTIKTLKSEKNLLKFQLEIKCLIQQRKLGPKKVHFII